MDRNYGSEDEASPPDDSLRFTPRLGLKRTASQVAENETPFNDLRQLARTIRTPSTVSQSAQRVQPYLASSESRLADRTDTLRNIARPAIAKYGRPVPAKRSAPSTPHAIRALEQRRKAAMTPSRERRRSGRQQRDSPWDVLRALSRVIKPDEKPPVERPSKKEASPISSSEEETPEVMEAKRPRLSLPIDEDDDFQMPPRISAALEDDLTQKSVELPRRAFLEQSMLGDRTRLSDVFAASPDSKAMAQRSSPGSGSPAMSMVIGNESMMQHMQGDETEDLRRTVFNRPPSSPQDETPRQPYGRDIDFADSTFRFDIPQDVPEPDENAQDSDDEDRSEGVQDPDEDVEEPEEDAVQPDLQYPDSPGSPDSNGPEPVFYDQEPESPESGPQIGPEAESEHEVIEESSQPLRSRLAEGQVGVEDEAAEEASEASEEAIEGLDAEGAERVEEAEEAEEVETEVEEAEEIEEAEEAEEAAEAADLFGAGSVSAVEATVTARTAANPEPAVMRKPKLIQKSRHGIDVPSLPVGVVKSIATSFVRSSGRSNRRLKKDTVDALMQATDWFFEQISDDLDAYSNHAQRGTIEEADALALMRRQRLVSATATPFSLAQKFLPRELLQEMRMEPPPDAKPFRRSNKTKFEVEDDSDAEYD